MSFHNAESQESPYGDWLLFQAVDDLEQLGAGILGIDLANHGNNVVSCIGDECGAHCTHIFTAGHLLFLPYAKGLVHFGGFIGKQDKIQIVLGDELKMRSRRILADADNDIPPGGKLFVIVAYGARLGSAAGSVILGIEIDNQRASFKIGSLYSAPFGINTENPGDFFTCFYVVM